MTTDTQEHADKIKALKQRNEISTLNAEHSSATVQNLENQLKTIQLRKELAKLRK